MNLKFRGNDLIVFLNCSEIGKLNFDNRIELEKYFKDLFIKIKKLYHINFKGYYDITIYVDKKIGVILEIQNDDSECFDYADDVVDMRLKQVSDEFVFKVDYDIQFINGKVDMYLYNDSLYLIPLELNDIEQGVLFENSMLFYGEEGRKIMNDLALVKLDKIW